MDLQVLGWSSHFEEQFESYRADGFVPARVVAAHKGLYTVCSGGGELDGRLTGRARHRAECASQLPVVGDWVVIRPLPGESTATIHAVLARKSCLSRKMKGALTDEQVVAVNIDTLMIVAGLDSDFNLRRIERYVTIAWNSGAAPVIVLNKADLCDDLPACLLQVERIALGIPVHAISALSADGLAPILPCFERGRTVALIGSSGVGKSTLINTLVGRQLQEVKALRIRDGRGQHTTTRRELIALPGGGLIMDNPGLKEIQLWGDSDGLKETFADLESLAAQCRFNDCSHGNEPGCAVQRALESGVLDAGRYRGYLKLERELRFLATRADWLTRKKETDKWKRIQKANRIRKKQGKH